jgi:hypothetical protein
MGVRTRGLDIKAGAAKLKTDRAARLEAELVVDRWNGGVHIALFPISGATASVSTAPGSNPITIAPLDVAPSPGYSRP